MNNREKTILMGEQWNKIFEQQGKVFAKPQEDIPTIVKLFKKRGVKRVLDLGCGSGRHAVYLAKRGFEVYGIDIAPEGIKITKDWLKKEKLKASLKIGSVYKKLPYRDNFFDAIISVQVIHHARIKTIQKAIREIERVLKPNGLIFVTVPRLFSKRNLKDLSKKAKIWKLKRIESRTFIPLNEDEKGLIHYYFNRGLLRKEFKNFKIQDIWFDTKRYHCLLGELKSKNDKD